MAIQRQLDRFQTLVTMRSEVLERWRLDHVLVLVQLDVNIKRLNDNAKLNKYEAEGTFEFGPKQLQRMSS